MKINVIITAGGKSQRYGVKNKLFEKCGESCVIIEAIRPFLAFNEVSKVIVGVETSFADEFMGLLDLYGLKEDSRITLSVGGESRTATVKNALNAIENDADIILVHDGARPYVTTKLIKTVIDGVVESKVCVPVVKLTSAVCDLSGEPRDRDEIRLVQTPFGADKNLFMEAYQNAKQAVYDDLSVVKPCFHGNIKLVDGEEQNIKITYQSDLKQGEDCPFVTGSGYDIHRTKKGNGIVICGVKIPCDFSLIAHSDGDVPVHAVMDAILSATGEKDIGHFFPVDDHKYDGADSLELLAKVLKITGDKGYRVHNVSVTLIAEKPMFAPFIDAMRKKLANMLGIDIGRVGIAATTNEKVGDIGKGNAVAAYASILLKRVD